MDSDRILAKAEEALRRHGAAPRLEQRARARRRASAAAKAARALTAAVLIILGAISWGMLIGPLQIEGIFITFLLLLLSTVTLSIFPRGDDARAEVLPTTQLALLPLKTEEWLASQRLALPAPAARLVDGIGLKLEALAPQLQMLDEREPAAGAIRRLIGDELPELIKGYQRVPRELRQEERHGQSPDAQLVEGLGVVDSELKRMSEQLAEGDLNKLATQGRYLELKYQGEDSA